MGDTGESYALPLDDLLQVLQSAGKTYQVRAALPASRLPFLARRGEAFVAEVVVTAGQVSSCVIREQLSGIRLEGARAFASVRSREQLVWMVSQVPSQEPAPPVAFSADAAHPAALSWVPAMALPWIARPAPVKLREDPMAMAHLTRRQRQVWLLIDGRRTVNDIAPLLGVPVEELDQELTALERKGLITSGHTRRERR